MPTTEQHDSTDFAGLDAATANLNASIAGLAGGVDSICVLVDELRSQRADLLAIARRIADMGERLLTGELDPPTPPHYRGSFALSQLVGDTIAAIAKAEGAK